MNIPDFVEYVFVMPFYEMYFPDTWNDNKLARNPHELNKLCAALNITIDTDALYDRYEQTKNREGDVYIYYSKTSKDVLLYFDLTKDEYDQMAMIVIGVRVPSKDKEKIKELLMELYFKSTTRSAFQEDYFNQGLWRMATGQVPENRKRKVHHMEG